MGWERGQGLKGKEHFQPCRLAGGKLWTLGFFLIEGEGVV